MKKLNIYKLLKNTSIRILLYFSFLFTFLIFSQLLDIKVLSYIAIPVHSIITNFTIHNINNNSCLTIPQVITRLSPSFIILLLLRLFGIFVPLHTDSISLFKNIFKCNMDSNTNNKSSLDHILRYWPVNDYKNFTDFITSRKDGYVNACLIANPRLRLPHYHIRVNFSDIGITQNSPEGQDILVFAQQYSGNNTAVQMFCDKVRTDFSTASFWSSNKGSHASALGDSVLDAMRNFVPRR